MSAFRVQFTALAEEDLIAIWDFYNQSVNQKTAERLLSDINLRIDTLADFPDRGTPREDLSSTVRMLVEGKFLIFYKFHKSTVLILRIVHGARDLSDPDLI